MKSHSVPAAPAVAAATTSSAPIPKFQQAASSTRSAALSTSNMMRGVVAPSRTKGAVGQDLQQAPDRRVRSALSVHDDSFRLRSMPLPIRIHWTSGIRDGQTKEQEAHSKQFIS